jgi:hypothetical protein
MDARRRAVLKVVAFATLAGCEPVHTSGFVIESAQRCVCLCRTDGVQRSLRAFGVTVAFFNRGCRLCRNPNMIR